MNKTIFKTYLIYFIALLTFVCVRIASSLGAFSWIQDAMTRSNVATIVIQIGVIFTIPFLLSIWLFKSKPKQVFKDFGFKKINFKSILICFAIGLLMFFLNIIIASFFSSILSMFGYSYSSGSAGYTYDTFPKFLLGVLFVAVLPGFCEEFLHRGLVMRKVGNETNYKYAILISALCFGLMHLNIEQFFYATILGIIMGFVGSVSDSIFPCMIMHFTNNFMSVYLTFAKEKGLFMGDFYSKLNSLYSNNSPIFTFIFTIFVLVLLIVGIVFLIIQLFKETRLKKLQQSLVNVQKEVSGDNIDEQSPQKLSSDFKNYILPQIESSKDYLSPFMPTAKSKHNKSLETNLFLIATLVLGFLITISTFIWGVI